MKILVTGATGLVGTHLLLQIIPSGHTIHALYRTAAKKEQAKRLFVAHFQEDGERHFNAIHWHQGCVTDIPKLTTIFDQGITHVYHCAAFISFNPSDYQTLRKVNIEGTANVVNLCIQYQVTKLCYVSSIATLSPLPVQQEAMDEDSEWNPESKNSVYSITKYGAEMEVWRGTQEGLDAVIVNPGVIIGPGFFESGSGQLFTKIAQGFRYYTTGTTGYVAVQDVVQIMHKLMNSERCNERYVLVGENLSYKAILTMIAKALHKPVPTTKVSPWGMRIAYYLDYVKWSITGIPPTIFRSALHSAFATHTYSSAKIKEEIIYSFMPIEKAVAHTATYFLNPV